MYVRCYTETQPITLAIDIGKHESKEAATEKFLEARALFKQRFTDYPHGFWYESDTSYFYVLPENISALELGLRLVKLTT